MSLPKPHDLTSLVLRTEFGDDAAWAAVRAAIDDGSEHPAVTYVSDTAYSGMSVPDLVDTNDAAPDDDRLTYVFVADAVTLAEGEHALLAVDLFGEPGRTFRVPPRWYADISANLSIANMDFADYADATDASGVFRGFSGA